MNEPTNRNILDALIGFKEAVETRFKHVDRRFEVMQADINRRFDRVDQRLDEHDRRFDEHAGKFTGLRAEMKAGFDELRREIRGKRKRD